MARINFVTYDDHPADGSIVVAAKAKAKAAKAPAPAKKPARAKKVKAPAKAKTAKAKKATEKVAESEARLRRSVGLGAHVKRLKAALGNAAEWKKAVDEVSGKKKEHIDHIAHKLTGGRKTWKTKKAALEAINQHFIDSHSSKKAAVKKPGKKKAAEKKPAKAKATKKPAEANGPHPDHGRHVKALNAALRHIRTKMKPGEDHEHVIKPIIDKIAADKTIKAHHIQAMANAIEGAGHHGRMSREKGLSALKAAGYAAAYNRDANGMAKRATPW